jgi:hypothetical protein
MRIREAQKHTDPSDPDPDADPDPQHFLEGNLTIFIALSVFLFLSCNTDFLLAV